MAEKRSHRRSFNCSVSFCSARMVCIISAILDSTDVARFPSLMTARASVFVSSSLLSTGARGLRSVFETPEPLKILSCRLSTGTASSKAVDRRVLAALTDESWKRVAGAAGAGATAGVGMGVSVLLSARPGVSFGGCGKEMRTWLFAALLRRATRAEVGACSGWEAAGAEEEMRVVGAGAEAAGVGAEDEWMAVARGESETAANVGISLVIST